MFTMRRILEAYWEFIVSTVLLALGLTFLFFLISNSDESRMKINDNIASKINITENKSVYNPEPFNNTRSMASVLYEIKETDLAIPIYISNREITIEMRKKFQNLNDSSEISAYLDVGYTYSKEYIVDAEGKVEKIVYRPSF